MTFFIHPVSNTSLLVRHWHGAAPDTAMTHLAIGERQEGQGVVWMEKVSDEQYFGQ